MEIKGEQIFLSEREAGMSDYPNPLALSDCPRLSEELDADIASLTQARAQDQLSSAEQGENMIDHLRLSERQRILDSIRTALVLEKGLPLEQEFEEIILRKH